jgi:hypothetical protein
MISHIKKSTPKASKKASVTKAIKKESKATPKSKIVGKLSA